MSLLKSIDCLMRDQAELFKSVSGDSPRWPVIREMLMILGLTAGVYGAAMGSYRWLHPEFFFSDFQVNGENKLSVYGKVIGHDPDKRRIFIADADIPSPLGPATVRFNVTEPTEPYRIVSAGTDKGFNFIELEKDAVLFESDSWKTPLLTMIKVPLLFALTLAVCILAMYVSSNFFGLNLTILDVAGVCGIALATTSVSLVVFVPIVFLFTVVTADYHFINMMHILVFALSGFFGVRTLVKGLTHIATAWMRSRIVAFVWLVLYGLIGAQIAWTLKPFIGTPYLPETPPFRLDRGNVYISFFRSANKVVTQRPVVRDVER